MEPSFLDPTTRIYAVCAAVLVLKMSFTSYATAVLRNVRGVFISPEDYAFRRRAPGPPDEQIERIRRAHHNDLESILPFLVVGFLASKSGAVGYSTAWWLFVPFTAARVLHTVAYGFGLQPWRSILFGVGDVALLATTVLLLVSVIR
ncbi:MAG: MAPEG family protein [Candidatus Binatia bacterium]